MNARFAPLVCALALAACDNDEPANRAVGQLESDRIELSVEFAEPIVERAVAEGESVAAGDMILRIDDARAQAELARVSADLQARRARLAELVRGPRREQIDAARALVDGAKRDLEFRETEFERAKRVHERQLASPESLDRAKAALDSARAELDAREARLEELLSGTTLEELQQAESDVAAAEALHSSARINLERHRVTAPVAGIVDTILYELGERPAIGKTAVVLLAGQQPYARAYVPEQIRVHVHPGQRVAVFVDGIDQPLQGIVRWVASDATFTPYLALTEYDRGRLSYLAKIDIDTDGQRLPDGVPVEVHFDGLDP